MATESEILLRAAAKIAAAERGAGASQETVSIHVTIKDSKAEYVVDTSGGEVTDASSAAAVSQARLHLVYATEEVFLALAHK